MQKIIFSVVVFLVAVGAVIVFIVMNPPQEQSEPEGNGNVVETEDSQAIDDEYLKKIAANHPEGETYVAAMVQARALLEDDDTSNDLSAVLDIATYLDLLGEKERALGWYQGALDIDATNIVALNNAANILDELGMYAESETVWLALLEIYPDRVPAYRSLGYLYRFRLGKSPGEIEDFFQTGLQATNNNVDLITWLVAYYMEIGDNARFAKYANLLNASSQPQ
jgi:tetratricopeptide (TPR) repeat protein